MKKDFTRNKKHFFFQYNRKGKYGIIGGSGTNCVEVINLHNRYISCSYPAPGTVLAITSHNERIAFGGTAPVLTIVRFHDPKHEKYKVESETEYDYTVRDPAWFDDNSATGDLEHAPQITSADSTIRSSIQSVNAQHRHLTSIRVKNNFRQNCLFCTFLIKGIKDLNILCGNLIEDLPFPPAFITRVPINRNKIIILCV